MNISDVHMVGDGGFLHVRGKGDKDRRIPIEAPLIGVIEAYLEDRIIRFPGRRRRHSPGGGSAWPTAAALFVSAKDETRPPTAPSSTGCYACADGPVSPPTRAPWCTACGIPSPPTSPTPTPMSACRSSRTSLATNPSPPRSATSSVPAAKRGPRRRRTRSTNDCEANTDALQSLPRGGAARTA